MYILGLDSFSANFCPMFVAFPEPKVQSAIDRLLPTTAHQGKAHGANKTKRFFANSWMCFIKRPRPKFRFLSRVDNLLTIGNRHWRKVGAMFEKAESANSLPFAREWGLFISLAKPDPSSQHEGLF